MSRESPTPLPPSGPRAFHRTELFWLGLVILVWAAELFFLQERVLISDFKTPNDMVTRRLFRLGLDLSLVGGLVALLPRRALYGLAALQLVLVVVGGVYFDHYGRLPRLTMLTGQAAEGAAVSSLLLHTLHPFRLTLFGGLLVTKILLLRKAYAATEHGAFARLHRRRMTGGAAATYVALFCIANLTFDPMKNMKKWGDASRFGITYGFGIPLFVEAWYASAESVLERALEGARPVTDRLTPIEADIPIDPRVVLLQVESLDWGALGRAWEGLDVTPGLTRLRGRSMVYKVEQAHFTGSADADFVAMMGRWPSPDVVTYKIERYPYDGALPHALRKLGVRSTAIHGVTGQFFNRREAYEKMGFDEILFGEELGVAGVPKTYAQFDWIQDRELFAFAASRLADEKGPALHLVITVTSHSPFLQLPPGDRARCPGGGDLAGDYFCSLRYVDEGLARYVDGAPAGTTFVIYGDHNSNVATSDYASGRVGDRDWVPVLVHSNTTDLSKLQKSGPVATDGSLTFVDFARWLQRQILRSHGGGKGRANGSGWLRAE